MVNIILIAPPAAGKGVQSSLLANKYKIKHISTGNLLREEVLKGTDLGNKLQEIMSQGRLVPDEIVHNLLKEELTNSKEDQGYVLDGFPRTIEQAIEYDKLSSEMNRDVDYVIYLDIPEEEAMKRALGRVSCTGCGEIYNEFFDKFDIKGYCNKCQGSLQKRGDDNEETFAKRFEGYLLNTKPLIDYYENKGLLHRVDSSKNKEYTFSQIEKIINEEF